jgi:hypothetical protein
MKTGNTLSTSLSTSLPASFYLSFYLLLLYSAIIVFSVAERPLCLNLSLPATFSLIHLFDYLCSVLYSLCPIFSNSLSFTILPLHLILILTYALYFILRVSLSLTHFLLSSYFFNSVATVKLFTTAGIPTSTVVDCAVGAVMAQVALSTLRRYLDAI